MADGSEPNADGNSVFSSVLGYGRQMFIDESCLTSVTSVSQEELMKVLTKPSPSVSHLGYGS
jgi:hypothetical protein